MAPCIVVEGWKKRMMTSLEAFYILGIGSLFFSILAFPKGLLSLAVILVGLMFSHEGIATRRGTQMEGTDKVLSWCTNILAPSEITFLDDNEFSTSGLSLGRWRTDPMPKIVLVQTSRDFSTGAEEQKPWLLTRKMENKDPVAGFANLRINGQVLTLSLWIKGLKFSFRAADCWRMDVETTEKVVCWTKLFWKTVLFWFRWMQPAASKFSIPVVWIFLVMFEESQHVRFHPLQGVVLRCALFARS